MIKFILTVIGFFCLILGIIGIFIPLLPTTPFLILSAFCFSKSSPSFYRWITSHPLFGPPILNWKNNKSIKLKHKLIAIGMMLLSVVYVSNKDTVPKLGKLTLILFLTLVSAFILKQKTSES